jgi:hypothetical protein
MVSSISISSNSLSLNLNDTLSVTVPPKSATQVDIQTILWLWLLARFHYINEKGRQIHSWHFDDPALIKANKVMLSGFGTCAARIERSLGWSSGEGNHKSGIKIF